ncbi:MAG: polysaccharide deacetylase family protein [Gemmatimonadota bacterium]|nr:polysaccharide deacetylase family protein [Gemmatimonadota bacterium]
MTHGGPTRAHPSRLPPILCYHKVDPRLELGVTRIAPRRFARQIERLAAAGWQALTWTAVVQCARGERTVGDRDIAITFDDGYRALRDHAFPVLAAQGWPSTCSVITDYAGKLNRWDIAYGGRRFAHLAWRDMRRWQSRGVHFISHTATHPRLTWLDERAVRDELERSRRAIGDALGIEPMVISYPFGAAGEREEQLARECGYDAGFTLAGAWKGSPMAIARTPVYMWAPPLPAVGRLRWIERMGAVGAGRCAVGTSVLKGVRS